MNKETKIKVWNEIQKMELLQKIEKMIDGMYFTFNEKENIGACRAFNSLLKDIKYTLKKELKKL
jgi:hypothetical protein